MGSYLEGQTISIAGTNWTVSVPTITEAGSNYIGTYENPAQLTISGHLLGSFLNLLSASGAKITMQLNRLPEQFPETVRKKKWRNSNNQWSLCPLYRFYQWR